ncbi:hypothetical protein IJM16_01715 [Candidatus Saccharibacteria bacterium]|nr:hypothetical protein [Candidatus Saccharibacteria bacterium]
MNETENHGFTEEMLGEITQSLDRNGPEFPYGWTGKVESMRLNRDGSLAVVVNGTYASGKNAKLRYRIENNGGTSWYVTSFVEIGYGKCAEECEEECILRSRFISVPIFEATIARYRKTHCSKDQCKEITSFHTVRTDSTAIIYINYVDGNNMTKTCCYRLECDDYDCWIVVDMQCPKC